MTDTVTLKATRKPPAHRAFEAVIVDRVYSSIIKGILHETPTISLSKLAQEFSAEMKCSVSSATMSRWLTLMGITYERTTTWTAKDAES